MTYNKPVPPVDALSAPYWRGAAEGKVLLSQCNECGHVMFYPRATCTRCLSSDLGWTPSSGLGEVYAFTVCHRAPDAVFRADVPYVIALIDLAEGPRMMSNVTDCDPESVRIGLPVQAWFDPVSDEIAIPKFKPIGVPK